MSIASYNSGLKGSAGNDYMFDDAGNYKVHPQHPVQSAVAVPMAGVAMPVGERLLQCH